MAKSKSIFSILKFLAQMILALAGVVLAYLFIAGQPSPGSENRVTPTYQNPYLFGLVNSAGNEVSGKIVLQAFDAVILRDALVD